MQFHFHVTVEVERIQGKFIARDELGEEIKNELDRADPGSIYTGESEYETKGFDVEVVDPPAKPRKLVTEPLKREPSRMARLRVMERVLAAEAPYDAVAAVVLAETRTEIECELRANPPRKRVPKAKPTTATEGAQS